MKATLLHAKAYTPPPAPPQPVTAKQAKAMGDEERLAYARLVRRWLNGHYFDSHRDRDIRGFLYRLIEDNAETLVGTRDVAIISGPNVMGKSTLLYQVGCEVHRQHVGPDGDPAEMARRITTRSIGGRAQQVYPVHAPVLLLSL